MVAQTDPGSTGKKLSKSDSEAELEARNKSFGKVLDAQIEWLRMRGQGRFDGEAEAKVRWKNKAEWHEKQYGF